MDNILLQIAGSKRVILFPPTDAPFLYLSGDKSKIVDFDQDDLEQTFPLLSKATRYECTLSPGDALFIPALWFHNTKALDFSIGVNFFWKDILLDEACFYQSSDVYGNKDLVPASNALTKLDQAIKNLSVLPAKYKNFYLSVMLARIEQELNRSLNVDEQNVY